mmetsp:Transcript_4403/g.7387  ORF Transcript_4403/g.7387 Transcript_4403/m.7387 type:complete len:218 (+) Transcript_4403:247-900(+)
MTFELGNTFYQDCDYFEESIRDDNIKALTYSAKTAKAPYSISKGPDVTSLSVKVDGNSLTVTAAASDAAWSSSNHDTSKQGVSEVRLSINEHPYDSTGVVGSVLSSGSSTVDISSLPVGRHMVYIQAVDGDGYKGPVTAAYFVKEGGPTDPSPVASPVSSPPGECSDTSESFNVDMIDMVKDCDWLAVNMFRFDFLCQFLDVANVCPLTCKKCDLFA